MSDSDKSASRGVYSVRLHQRSGEKRIPVKRYSAGTVLEDKYELAGVIGEGGMGVVYEAEHLSLGVSVAIKVLHPSDVDVPNMIDRFRVEARSSAGIRHPNVVDVTDFGLTPDRRPFFVMELLSGESLADRLERVGSLEEREVVDITDQMLGGLASAHRKGIVHRDLKPENVFLHSAETGGLRVKLLDFGVAKIVGGPTPQAPSRLTTGEHEQLAATDERGRRLTQRGMVLGTPGYLAPESSTGKLDVDARSDLFSVGVLVYEMLTGRLPFRGETVHEILKNTLRSPVPRPTLVKPGISEAMERLALTALAKKPSERFQTAEEFLRHLTAAAVGRIPDAARPCKTETGLPSVVPPGLPRRSWSAARGDQEAINTMGVEGVDNEPEDDPERASVSVDRPSAGQQPRTAETTSPSGRFSPPRLAMVLAGAVLLALATVAVLAWLFSRDEVEAAAGSPSRGDVPAVGPQAPRETVTVWLDVKPLGTRIVLNGEEIETRPLVVEKSDRAAVLQFSAPGYRSQIEKIVPDHEQTIRVSLESLAAPAPETDSSFSDSGS